MWFCVLVRIFFSSSLFILPLIPSRYVLFIPLNSEVYSTHRLNRREPESRKSGEENKHNKDESSRAEAQLHGGRVRKLA